ncbi:MAG: AbrB/MazE/SpoVT family DNA-binding domain-containing protein [Candidatus Competibacteraceae bacterium]
MEMIKLGKRGQISIPKSILNQLGLKSGLPILVETTADGAIILRPAAAYPIELYSEERIAEFDEADRMDDAVAKQLAPILNKRQ